MEVKVMATKKPKNTKSKPKKIAGVPVAPTVPRKKNPPRTSFKKGGPNPHAFVAGNGSPNPGGKPKSSEARLLSKALFATLSNRAPNEVATGFGLKPGSSWAQCIAQRLVVMAVRGDLAAVVEIRTATEGTRSHASMAFTDDDGNPQETPPLILIEFVQSDGNGYPAPPGSIIDGVCVAAPCALPAAKE
jgi:hypothetical protein